MTEQKQMWTAWVHGVAMACLITPIPMLIIAQLAFYPYMPRMTFMANAWPILMLMLPGVLLAWGSDADLED